MLFHFLNKTMQIYYKGGPHTFIFIYTGPTEIKGLKTTVMQERNLDIRMSIILIYFT